MTATWPAGTQLRSQRHARQVKLGLHKAALSPLEREVGPPYHFPDALEKLGPSEINRPLPWGELTAEQRRFQATKMAIHAAMVDRMDREIGRVLDQLRAMGAFDNTLILFASDNGASAEIMVRHGGHDPAAAPGSAATYLCLGPGFSSAANTPFRRHKTWVHEGGISTPFIVHWPEGIAARGELRTDPSPFHRRRPHGAGAGRRQATRGDLAGDAGPARTRQEPRPRVCQGRRRAARQPVVAARGQPGDPRRRLEARRRQGRSRGSCTTWQTDRSEMKNLAAQHPDKVRELSGSLDRGNGGDEGPSQFAVTIRHVSCAEPTTYNGPD